MHFTYQVITQKKDTKKMKENKTLKRIIIVVLLLTGISALSNFDSYFTISIENSNKYSEAGPLTIEFMQANQSDEKGKTYPYFIYYRAINKSHDDLLLVELTDENSPHKGDIVTSEPFYIAPGETIIIKLEFERISNWFGREKPDTVKIYYNSQPIASFMHWARTGACIERLVFQSFNPRYMYKSKGFKDDYIYREDNIFPLIFGNQMDEIQSFWL